ncbi:hypothetical protein ILUMI_00699 [Ignelater luminosus]|uniref:TTF-type domain-containing protein n=1 Tax=Ignelater luminosus TaxID=2038154 RepID=A0A8K0DJW4_IGNLU|nr:hypothetical protein ILUMI_00699 [Ignelater luminosus]
MPGALKTECTKTERGITCLQSLPHSKPKPGWDTPRYDIDAQTERYQAEDLNSRSRSLSAPRPQKALKDETDLNSAAQQQQSSVEQSTFEKTDIYVFDKKAVEESSISITVEDASQNQTLSNYQVQTTVNLNKDPALWEINDTLKDGFDENNSCDFSKSEKIYADQRRFLPVSIFQRKIKNNEVNDQNWLVYSESKRSVYCGPCLVFGPLENKTQFENEGFNDWKMQNTASEIDGRLDNLLHVQIDKEITYWRNVLKRVVAVVKRLCSRGLAFRGKNEKFDDPHNGNYRMILELLAEFDHFLASHIERFGNQGSTSYLSKTVCDDSTQRWQKLMTEIRKGKTLKRVNLTRWSARKDACRSLRDSWHEVLKILESIKDDCIEKPVTQNEATGILLNLEKLETAATTVDLITVADLYESLCKFFVDTRENFKYCEENAMELSVSKQYTKDMGK